MICVIFKIVSPCSVVFCDNEVFSSFKGGEYFIETFVKFFVDVCVVDVIVPSFNVHGYNAVGLVVFVIVKLVYGVWHCQWFRCRNSSLGQWLQYK